MSEGQETVQLFAYDKYQIIVVPAYWHSSGCSLLGLLLLVDMVLRYLGSSRFVMGSECGAIGFRSGYGP